MSETEKFIEIVRQYPILYDITNKDYKNIKRKDSIWDDIAKSWGSNGEYIESKQYKIICKPDIFIAKYSYLCSITIIVKK